MKSDMNSHILEVINSAIDRKVIPRIRSVLGDQNAARTVNMDLRSDGSHPSSRPQWDLGSNGRHQENVSETVQNTKKDIPRLLAMSNNHPNHHRENHEDPNQSDGDDNYDMVTGTNPTPQMVLECLTRCSTDKPYQSSCRRDYGHEQQTISTDTDGTTSQYNHTHI